ncbi:MAG: transposase [Rickettsiaceae bacterium]
MALLYGIEKLLQSQISRYDCHHRNLIKYHMGSRKKKSYSTSRKLSKFRVTNWSSYNNILRNRGRVDFMIAEHLGDGWYEENDGNKKRGGQKRYSDKAILMCLQIKYLFDLKPWQSEGFINWIFEISDLYR